MKLCKKFLSLTLALCMALALLPTTAFATVSSISASKKVACLPTTGLVADFPAAATFSFGVEPKRTVDIEYSPIKYAETNTENQYYKEIKALTEELISSCDTDMPPPRGWPSPLPLPTPIPPRYLPPMPWASSTAPPKPPLTPLVPSPVRRRPPCWPALLGCWA